MHATSWKTGQLAEKEIIIHINFSDAFINSWPFVCQPFLSQILYHYCNLGVKFTLVSEWPKQMQRYLYGAGAGAVTHKHSLTEAQIREETAPRLPIIRAEVYGRRELQGISEIKLHRRRTSNTEETSQALERMMGFGWAGNFLKKEIREQREKEGCITPNLSPLLPLRLVVLRHTAKQGFTGLLWKQNSYKHSRVSTA